MSTEHLSKCYTKLAFGHSWSTNQLSQQLTDAVSFSCLIDLCPAYAEANSGKNEYLGSDIYYAVQYAIALQGVGQTRGRELRSIPKDFGP